MEGRTEGLAIVTKTVAASANNSNVNRFETPLTIQLAGSDKVGN